MMHTHTAAVSGLTFRRIITPPRTRPQVFRPRGARGDERGG